MSRVKWKGPYVTNNLLKKITNSFLENKNEIKTVSRDSVILPKFIGLNLRVYNGKTFDFYKVEFEYNEDILNDIKKMSKRRYYPQKKYWGVSLKCESEIFSLWFTNCEDGWSKFTPRNSNRPSISS